MITVEAQKKTSSRILKSKNYTDYKRLMDIYDRWDVAAKAKDFHYAEHCEYEIKKIHERNGIKET